MKNTYFKPVEAKNITPRMLNDVLLSSSATESMRILEEMKDKRGLLRGHIETIEFCVMPRAREFHSVKVDAFVCARTGYVLTLDFIKGFELSENSPSKKHEQMQIPTKTSTEKGNAGAGKAIFNVSALDNYPVSGDAIADGLRELAGKKKADKKPAKKDAEKETTNAARGLTTNIKNKIAKIALLVALPLLAINPAFASDMETDTKILLKNMECQTKLLEHYSALGTPSEERAKKESTKCLAEYDALKKKNESK